MDHREIIARALAEFRFDLDERGRPIIGPVTIERMTDAIIADLDKRGLCIVPVEPTTEMWDQAENASIITETAFSEGDPKTPEDASNFPTYRVWSGVVMYRAMISAAPK